MNRARSCACTRLEPPSLTDRNSPLAIHRIRSRICFRDLPQFFADLRGGGCGQPADRRNPIISGGPDVLRSRTCRREGQHPVHRPLRCLAFAHVQTRRAAPGTPAATATTGNGPPAHAANPWAAETRPDQPGRSMALSRCRLGATRPAPAARSRRPRRAASATAPGRRWGSTPTHRRLCRPGRTGRRRRSGRAR